MVSDCRGNRPMRIRHILPQPAMGMLPADPRRSPLTGIANVTWHLARYQAAAGHAVEIVAPTDRRAAVSCIDGVKIRWLPLWARARAPRYDLSVLLPLIVDSRRAPAVDITHVHANPFFLRATRRTKRVLHFHYVPEHRSRQYARAVAGADAIVCCSDFIRRQVLEKLDCSPALIHVLPNGVEWCRFADVDRAAARDRYDIPPGQAVLLYVGRIGPEKGLAVLLDAMERLVHQHDQQPLLLVAGSGMLGFEGHADAWPALQAYERDIVERSRDLPVRFLGDVAHADLPALYRAADVFVCPSICQEGFGLVNVEAAAAGTPTVASAVGGIPEIVVHERTGLLVPPADSSALARALQGLIRDAALRSTMGSAARDLARSFDWSVLNGSLSRIYEGMVSG